LKHRQLEKKHHEAEKTHRDSLHNVLVGMHGVHQRLSQDMEDMAKATPRKVHNDIKDFIGEYVVCGGAELREEIYRVRK
jgi:hypothetical protein